MLQRTQDGGFEDIYPDEDYTDPGIPPPGDIGTIPDPTGGRGWPGLPGGPPRGPAAPTTPIGSRIGRFSPSDLDYGDFAAPSPFKYKDYEGPTADTFVTDPGYGFRAKEGERAIKNNKSAEGLARSGAALKDLMAYNQGLASQEFGNVDARMFRNYSAGRTNAKDSYDSLVEGALAEYNSRVSRSRDSFDRQYKGWMANASQDNAMIAQLLSLAQMMQPPAPQY